MECRGNVAGYGVLVIGNVVKLIYAAREFNWCSDNLVNLFRKV